MNYYFYLASVDDTWNLARSKSKGTGYKTFFMDILAYFSISMFFLPATILCVTFNELSSNQHFGRDAKKLFEQNIFRVFNFCCAISLILLFCHDVNGLSDKSCLLPLNEFHQLWDRIKRKRNSKRKNRFPLLFYNISSRHTLICAIF